MTLFALSFILWAVVHSLTAASSFKAWVRRRVGERRYAGFYRLFYNLFSLISFLPVLLVLALRVPATILWRIPFPFSLFFVGVQLAGLGGLLASLAQTDPLQFAGVRQVIRYLRGDEDPAPTGQLVTGGAYALVRHPLYFFSLLVIWFTPIMTLNTLLFNLLATLYFVLGAIHEERRLAAEFGDEYRRYQEQVATFIPFLF